MSKNDVQGHQLITVNFYDDNNRELHLANIASMLDEGWYLESHNSFIKGGILYHSFLLMKGPNDDPPNARGQ